MSDFAHVEDALIRSVLLGDLSEDALCYALRQTELAFAADENNEDVPFEVLSVREQAIEDAVGWWNDEGNAFRAVESLQQYWSV